MKERIQKLVEMIRTHLESSKILKYSPLLKELEEMGVFLDEDPTAVGLKKLNLKIAQIDAQKTRAGNILLQAIKNENELNNFYKNILNTVKLLRSEALLLPETAKLSNQQLREASVDLTVGELTEHQENVSELLDTARTFTKMAQNKFNDLDSTNKNISRQLTVIQTQVEIGEIVRYTNNTNNTNDISNGANYTF